jgi:hypothetical protein
MGRVVIEEAQIQGYPEKGITTQKSFRDNRGGSHPSVGMATHIFKKQIQKCRREFPLNDVLSAKSL